MSETLLAAVRALRVADPELGLKPLLAKLREQQPDLGAATREVHEALLALKAESEAAKAAAASPAAAEGGAPLPGGYTVGEQVYYTGATKTFATGDQLEHGKQGEVVGAAISKNLRGKRVDVRFPGNKGVIGCYLTNVHRGRRVASHSSPLPLHTAHP